MYNIALDGPSGSGKSTLAKAISKKLNILYLDTGAMYRACGLKAKQLNISTKDEEMVKTFINDIDIKIEYKDGAQVTKLDGIDVSNEIRQNDISMLASNISALQCVREKLVSLQREIALMQSCILDGRDIGTNVLPFAKYKFFITASLEERTNRRFKELKEKGQDVDYDTLYKEIEQRDYNDSHREFAPLKQATDAILIDTSEMTIEEVISNVLSYVKE